MKTTEPSPISPEVAAELQEALDNLAKGVRDPEKMRTACARRTAASSASRTSRSS
jgi:hypothetical protein